MSAFIVSTETMQRVIAAIDASMGGDGIFGSNFELAEPGFLVRNSRDLDVLGTALFAMNADAVEERYRERDEAPTFSYRPLGPVTEPEAYMAISCLIYQCSEGSVPERGLYKALTELSNRLAHSIAHGFANARKVPWDWPEKVMAA